MGTVVGIIDGTGSLGAAFGQLLVRNYCKLLMNLDWSCWVKLKLEYSFCHDVSHDFPQLHSFTQACQKRNHWDIHFKKTKQGNGDSSDWKRELFFTSITGVNQ